MRASRRKEVLQNKVGHRELKQVYHFKCFGRNLTRDAYCTKKSRKEFL